MKCSENVLGLLDWHYQVANPKLLIRLLRKPRLVLVRLAS